MLFRYLNYMNEVHSSFEGWSNCVRALHSNSTALLACGRTLQEKYYMRCGACALYSNSTALLACVRTLQEKYYMRCVRALQ